MNKVFFADLFSQPIRLKTKDHNGLMTHHYGTCFGLTLTVIGISIWGGYFVHLWQEMNQGNLDTIVINEITNDLQFSEILIKDYHFMPSINVK